VNEISGRFSVEVADIESLFSTYYGNDHLPFVVMLLGSQGHGILRIEINIYIFGEAYDEK